MYEDSAQDSASCRDITYKIHRLDDKTQKGYSYTSTTYAYGNRNERVFVRATGLMVNIQVDADGKLLSLRSLFVSITGVFVLVTSAKAAAQFLLLIGYSCCYCCCWSCSCCCFKEDGTRGRADIERNVVSRENSGEEDQRRPEEADDAADGREASTDDIQVAEKDVAGRRLSPTFTDKNLSS